MPKTQLDRIEDKQGKIFDRLDKIDVAIALNTNFRETVRKVIIGALSLVIGGGGAGLGFVKILESLK